MGARLGLDVWAHVTGLLVCVCVWVCGCVAVLYQVSNILGNLGGYLVFDQVANSPWFYATFTIVAGAGALTFLGLSRIPRTEQPRVAPRQKRTVCDIMRRTSHQVANRSILAMAPMFFWTGTRCGGVVRTHDDGSVTPVLLQPAQALNLLRGQVRSRNFCRTATSGL